MLPTRKIKEIKPKSSIRTTRKKKYIQYGGAEVGEQNDLPMEAEAVSDLQPEPEPEPEQNFYQEIPYYKAPGILKGLSKYSQDVISVAVNLAKNAILGQLKIQPKPGETSLELYKEVNAVLQDPKTRLEFLEFVKNMADRGLTFIQITRPLASKSVDVFVEIFEEILEESGKSIVEITKGIAGTIPVVGNVLEFIFLFDEIVKFFQSGMAAFFQTGTNTYEVIATARQKMDRASDLNNASPDIKQAAEEIEKVVDDEKIKIIQEQEQKLQQQEQNLQQEEQKLQQQEQNLQQEEQKLQQQSSQNGSNINQTGGGKKRLLKILSLLKKTKKNYKKNKKHNNNNK